MSKNDIHQIINSIEEEIASNKSNDKNTENRVLRTHNNLSLEDGLKEYRDPHLKKFRLEMLTLLSSFSHAGNSITHTFLIEIFMNSILNNCILILMLFFNHIITNIKSENGIIFKISY